jgi:hypothetical protein
MSFVPWPVWATEKTKGPGWSPGALQNCSRSYLLRTATAADADRAILARSGRGGAGGKSKGGQDYGEQGDFADDHGDLEGIKL